jgi:hypothetical protein
MILHIFSHYHHLLSNKNMHMKSSCLGVLLLCLVVHARSFGQESYKVENLKKIDSIVNSYKLKNKYRYLNLLPNVSYDAFNNAFNVGFSLTGLANYYQQKQRNKIQLAQLENRLKEKLDNDIDKINLEIQEFHYDLIILENEVELFKIDADLFKITQGKYNNKEITTEEYLKLKRSYLKAKHILKSKTFKLHLKADAIKQKTGDNKLVVFVKELEDKIKRLD